VFIILAPVFYSATIYMLLGRIMASIGAGHLSIIRPTRLTKIFIAGDILSLTVQGNATGLTARKDPSLVAEKIIILGLFIQLAVFAFFIIATIIFDRRIRRQVTKDGNPRPEIPWRQGMTVLYVCSGLIIVRSIFRAVEYIMGLNGYLLTHEWPLYVFDGALMWSCQVVFLIWFPSKFQPKPHEVNGDGRVPEEKEGSPA
jgi:hypothetical protein